MEFNEKLQELRKAKGLTQEELAEDLYISRTAVSKWESGRGLPSIDSLRQIATYFGVTIDELLSGDALLNIAEKENKAHLQRTYNMLSGATDLFSFLLIVLPLYPQTIDGFVYSVNLAGYSEVTSRNLTLYWIMFAALTVIGAARLLLKDKHCRILSDLSIVLSIIVVAFLALSREAYACVLAFMLLVIKGVLWYNTANKR